MNGFWPKEAGLTADTEGKEGARLNVLPRHTGAVSPDASRFFALDVSCFLP